METLSQWERRTGINKDILGASMAIMWQILERQKKERFVEEVHPCEPTRNTTQQETR